MLVICMKIDGGTTWHTAARGFTGPKEKPPGTLSASTVWVISWKIVLWNHLEALRAPLGAKVAQK